MASDPAEEEDNKWKGGGAGRGGEGGGLPTLVEVMVERHKNHAEESDEADQCAERHDELAERLAFTLARETKHAM